MGKVFKSIASVIPVVAVGKALGVVKDKKPKVAGVTADTGDLQEEAKQTAKQRQALFMTEGGILGEEVEGVSKKKRGTILGN